MDIKDLERWGKPGNGVNIHQVDYVSIQFEVFLSRYWGDCQICPRVFGRGLQL